MSTKITRFRNLLILALMCLVSGSVWGQETKIAQITTFPTNSADGQIDENIYYYEISGGANISAYNPKRIYAKNSFAIEAKNGAIITQIEITYGTSSYQQVAQTFYIGTNSTSLNTIPDPSTGSNTKRTFSFTKDNEYTYFKLTNTSSAQTRISGVSVTYDIAEVLPTPTFTYSSKEITINQGDKFIEPTLTYNNNPDLSTLSIIYESSNTSVATIDNTGKVTLTGEAGKTEIKATVAKTETYASAETSYTLIVKETGVLLYTDFQDWEKTDGTSYVTGPYTNPETGITIEYEYMIKKGAVANVENMGTCSNDYIQMRDKAPAGIIKLPPFSNVKNIQLNIIATSTSRTIKLYNGDKLLDTYTANKTGATYTYTVPADKQSNEFNFIIKDQDGAVYICDIKVVGASVQEPKSTIDETTGAMTLTGAWTAEAVKALEIPANVTSVDMTAINVDVLPTTIGNPNCLFYVKENSTLEDFNVIAGNSAVIGIELQDGYDFYNTKSFTGDITYSRTFASGWNTFALPFNTAIPNGVQVEAFDKKDGNQILFTEAMSIKANTAYLINVQADGKISFSANNVTVPVTATTGDTYKSNFLHMTGDDIAGKYILVIEEGVEVFARANAGAQMHAFRGYLDLPAASGVQYSISHDGGATGINNTDTEGIKIYSVNGALIINTDKTQSIQIYGLDGRMVKNIQVSEGENTVTGLAKGIYLINNQKAIIK